MKYKIIAAIPVRDGGWIIGKTLSVLETFCDKIIIVNDNSTDNTKEVCAAFGKTEWHDRAQHDWKKREEGLQRQELMDFVSPHNPDYILFLDCDEIPTPSFLNFMKNIDESVNLWSLRFINLYEDERHYRIDSFITPRGLSINWDPFKGNGWRKWALMKYDPSQKYTYDITCERGPVGKLHPAPGNTKQPHKKTEDFYIIHYGKIGEDFKSGEKNIMYAHQDNYVGRGSVEERIRHHVDARGESAKILKECPDEWFWRL